MGTNPMPNRNKPDAKVSMGRKTIPIRDESNVEICYVCEQTRCRRGINPMPKYCEASMGTNPMQNLHRAVQEQTPRHSTTICSKPDWHHLSSYLSPISICHSFVYKLVVHPGLHVKDSKHSIKRGKTSQAGRTRQDMTRWGKSRQYGTRPDKARQDE